MIKVSIIGVGRLGGALAIALAGRGYRIENLVERTNEKAKKIAARIDQKIRILSPQSRSRITSDVVFIATQDASIENAARSLIDRLPNAGTTVFHTSGALSSSVLNDLRSIGCSAASFHPLVSVSDSSLGADRFEDVYFCLEGDPEAVQTGKGIVDGLGGRSFSIEARKKGLYHAAAVTACGHIVALIDSALEILCKCGLSHEVSLRTLLPLIRSTVENLENQTTAQALTGPFARADVKTVEEHLKALTADVSPEAVEIYLNLGLRSADLAEQQGANPENLQLLRNMVLLAKRNLKC